jgi:hypothetical protein
VATAVVAGLIALAGILVCRWLFDIPVLAPRRDGAYGDAHTTAMALVAAVVALAATGLIYLLLLSTPRPIAFFGWIIGIATLLMVVFPWGRRRLQRHRLGPHQHRLVVTGSAQIS